MKERMTTATRERALLTPPCIRARAPFWFQQDAEALTAIPAMTRGVSWTKVAFPHDLVCCGAWRDTLWIGCRDGTLQLRSSQVSLRRVPLWKRISSFLASTAFLFLASSCLVR